MRLYISRVADAIDSTRANPVCLSDRTATDATGNDRGDLRYISLRKEVRVAM